MLDAVLPTPLIGVYNNVDGPMLANVTPDAQKHVAKAVP
jgi:hypothetical protein